MEAFHRKNESVLTETRIPCKFHNILISSFIGATAKHFKLCWDLHHVGLDREVHAAAFGELCLQQSRQEHSADLGNHKFNLFFLEENKVKKGLVFLSSFPHSSIS